LACRSAQSGCNADNSSQSHRDDGDGSSIQAKRPNTQRQQARLSKRSGGRSARAKDRRLMTSQVAPTPMGGRVLDRAHYLGRQLGAIYPVMVPVAVCAALAFHAFDTGVNIRSIFVGAAVTGIVGLGETIIAIAGGMADLSVASVFGLVAVLVIRIDSSNMALGLLAGIGLGLAVGIVNGVLSGYLGGNSVIVTLGTGSIVGGIALWYSGGATFNGGSNVGLTWLTNSYGVIPVIFLALILLAALTEVFLQTTRLGRSWYAVGGRALAAQVAGINVKRTRAMSFVFTGGLVAIAAEIFAIFYNSATYQSGSGYLFPAIAGVAVGGTNLLGGEGGALRTVGGVLFIALLQDIVVVAGISFFYQNVVVGAAIVAGVLVGMHGRKGWLNLLRTPQSRRKALSQA
jgi:ribose/xylose/arabinose/galactoside ABC-type transport system permease subunit